MSNERKTKEFSPAEIAEIREATKDEKIICTFDVLPKTGAFSFSCYCPKCTVT